MYVHIHHPLDLHAAKSRCALAPSILALRRKLATLTTSILTP
jgi:hypothetical protein